MWYGVPRIVSRFLFFGISLLTFQLFDPNGSYAYTQIYALMPFLNILFTYGLETSYFRFAQLHDRKELYNTLNTSIIISTFLFSALLLLLHEPVTNLVEMNKRPEFVTWMIGIVFFDTLCALPMAKLRLEERPRKYALVNVTGVLINIGLVLFFYFVAKHAYENDRYTFLGTLYRPEIGIGYFLIANLVASAATLLLLYKEFAAFRFSLNVKLLKEVLLYSYPLVIVGFGGMINEMLSRLVYQKIIPGDTQQEEFELGVFGANYKLAVVVTIFIQIFRLAAEPFFFNQSKQEGAQRMYARVMKFFVIACCFMFLSVALFLDGWKLLIAYRFPSYAEGIHIVPILAMGSVFLGIYYNLSVWYKLTNRNMMGAWITLAGAALTIVLNVVLIPHYRYTGAAWATLVCYASMMVASYLLGQKYYPVPYARKKLLAYIAIVTLLYLLHEAMVWPLNEKAGYYPFVYFGTALLLLGSFAWLILKVEKREFVKLPYIGKWVEKV